MEWKLVWPGGRIRPDIAIITECQHRCNDTEPKSPSHTDTDSETKIDQHNVMIIIAPTFLSHCRQIVHHWVACTIDSVWTRSGSTIQRYHDEFAVEVNNWANICHYDGHWRCLACRREFSPVVVGGDSLLLRRGSRRFSESVSGFSSKKMKFGEHFTKRSCRNVAEGTPFQSLLLLSQRNVQMIVSSTTCAENLIPSIERRLEKKTRFGQVEWDLRPR